MANIKLSTALVVLSGLLLVLSSPGVGGGWLVLFGFLPLFIALQTTSRVQSAFRYGYGVGLIYFSFIFLWIWEAYPLSAVGVTSRPTAILFLFLAWGLTVITQALPWGLAGACWKKTEKSFSWSSLLSGPAVFLVFEYLRSYLISLVWLAPQSVIGPHWTIGNLAYNLSETGFLKMAPAGGIYGLTFFMVLVNILLFLFLEKKRFLFLGLTLAIVFFFPELFRFLTKASLQTSPFTPSLKVAAIQSVIPSTAARLPAEEELAWLRKQLVLMQKISQQHPDTALIVWPEQSNFSTRLSLLANTASAAEYFQRLFPQQAVTIVDQAKIHSAGQIVSRSLVVNSQQGIVGTYDKRLLTPNGEFVPWIFEGLIRWLRPTLSPRSLITEFSPGDQPSAAISVPDSDQKIGVLICSDLVTPIYARKLSGEGSAVLISQVSLGFVNGSTNLYRQMSSWARWRAAENAKPLIFAPNFAPAFILNHRGELISRNFQPGFEILTARLVLNDKKTLYNKIGDTPWVMAGLVVLATALILKNRQ